MKSLQSPKNYSSEEETGYLASYPLCFEEGLLFSLCGWGRGVGVSAPPIITFLQLLILFTVLKISPLLPTPT